MRRLYAALLAVASAFAIPLSGMAQKTMFYMTDEGYSVRDFLAHRSKIDIIVPTWYNVDQNGLVYGEPDPAVLQAAKQSHVAIFPIVTLMNPTRFHQLAGDQHAQDVMNEALIRECKLHGYDGFQFDIEDVYWTDRDGLSALVQRTADALHAQHLQLQIAVVPGAPGYPGSTKFDAWIYKEWRGGYDLAAIGKAVDLLCLMTYDQHTHWTEPGPVGGWVWTNENLDFALKSVPAAKLSLGIAAYGYHWYTGDPGFEKEKQTPNPTADYISAADARQLRDSYGGHEEWDPVDHTAWFYFYRDQLREWVFYTEKHGYSDRLELAKQKGLEGTCAWVLGQEDEAIWSLLPDHK